MEEAERAATAERERDVEALIAEEATAEAAISALWDREWALWDAQWHRVANDAQPSGPECREVTLHRLAAALRTESAKTEEGPPPGAWTEWWELSPNKDMYGILCVGMRWFQQRSFRLAFTNTWMAQRRSWFHLRRSGIAFELISLKICGITTAGTVRRVMEELCESKIGPLLAQFSSGLQKWKLDNFPGLGTTCTPPRVAAFSLQVARFTAQVEKNLTKKVHRMMTRELAPICAAHGFVESKPLVRAHFPVLISKMDAIIRRVMFGTLDHAKRVMIAAQEDMDVAVVLAADNMMARAAIPALRTMMDAILQDELSLVEEGVLDATQRHDIQVEAETISQRAVDRVRSVVLQAAVAQAYAMSDSAAGFDRAAFNALMEAEDGFLEQVVVGLRETLERDVKDVVGRHTRLPSLHPTSASTPPLSF